MEDLKLWKYIKYAINIYVKTGSNNNLKSSPISSCNSIPLCWTWSSGPYFQFDSKQHKAEQILDLFTCIDFSMSLCVVNARYKLYSNKMMMIITMLVTTMMMTTMITMLFRFQFAFLWLSFCFSDGSERSWCFPPIQ